MPICPDCGADLSRLCHSHKGSKACGIRKEARDRLYAGLLPLPLHYRTLLDEAGVKYEVGMRLDHYHRTFKQLFAPAWAAAAILAPKKRLWGPEGRPAWQRRRLLQLAVLHWCLASDENRDALDAAIAATHDPEAESVWWLLRHQVEVTASTPYQFARAGQRTFAAVRTRRLGR